MTRGNPIRLILGFMIPTCLGNIFQQFYNLVDSVIAGRYIGVNALAAIGSTSSLIFLVIGWMNGITSGFAIMVAQSFGAKAYDRMRHYVAMSIYLCLGFIVVMTGGLLMLNEPILRLMNAPEEIIYDTASYMAIIYAGLFVTASYNAFAAVLRALGDGRSPLYFLIISALLNVVLDVAFIVNFHMGVEGCAYATVIAQGVSALLCLIYIIRKFEILKLKREDFWVDFAAMRQLLAIGIPMGLQFSITAVGTIIVQGAVNVFGAVYIAGYSAAGKIQNIVATVFVSFGATIATYVGQNRGAGQIDRIRKGVRYTQGMILAWSVVMIAAIQIFGEPLIHVFVEDTQTDVIEAAKLYFTTVSWCYPFLGSIFLYRNALQGLGYGFMPMMGGVFELLARAAAVSIVVRVGLGFGGVCAADPAAWVAALIPIVPYYFHVMKRFGRKGEQGAAEKIS